MVIQLISGCWTNKRKEEKEEKEEEEGGRRVAFFVGLIQCNRVPQTRGREAIFVTNETIPTMEERQLTQNG